jgi:hypothetical protein
MSKLEAGIRLIKLLKIQSLLHELYHDDEFNYDVIFEDYGLVVENSSLDEVSVEDMVDRIKLMVSAAKLDIDTKDLK